MMDEDIFEELGPFVDELKRCWTLTDYEALQIASRYHQSRTLQDATDDGTRIWDMLSEISQSLKKISERYTGD